MTIAAAVAKEWMPFNATVRWKQPHVAEGVVDAVRSKLFGATGEAHEVYAGQGMSGFLTNYDDVKIGAKLLSVPRFAGDTITSASYYGRGAANQIERAVPDYRAWHGLNWGAPGAGRDSIPEGMARSWDEMNAKVRDFAHAPQDHVLIDLSINQSRGVYSGSASSIPAELRPLLEVTRDASRAARGIDGRFQVGETESLLDGIARLAAVVD